MQKPWGFAAKLYFRGVLPLLGGLTAAYAADEFLELSFLFALLFGVGTGLLAFQLADVAEGGDEFSEALGAVLRGTLAVALAPVTFAVTLLLVGRAGTFPALPLAMVAGLVGASVAYGALYLRNKQQPTSRILIGRAPGGVREAIVKAHLDAERSRRETGA